MGDAGGQLFSSLRGIGWFVKPLWGLISDRVPLFGYRRKSWYVLMACLTLVFWALTALLAYAGVGVPIVYLVTLNLAFATYAFVDVVCDALMVTEGRRLKRVGSFVNFQWTTFAIALALSVLLGGWLQQQVEKGAIEPWLIFPLDRHAAAGHRRRGAAQHRGAQGPARGAAAAPRVASGCPRAPAIARRLRDVARPLPRVPPRQPADLAARAVHLLLEVQPLDRLHRAQLSDRRARFRRAVLRRHPVRRQHRLSALDPDLPLGGPALPGRFAGTSTSTR